MQTIYTAFLLLLIGVPMQIIGQEEESKSTYTLHYDPVDAKQSAQIVRWLEEGKELVNSFFGRDYKSQFGVYLFSERDSLGKQWQKDWNMPKFKSRCWMVASGIAHRLDVLSPRVWKEQACGHDVRDTLATKRIIIHEMVHVFHGQYNPSPTFEDVDNIDWFAEGLAVYASGQLDQERYSDARRLIISKGGPKKLSKVWKGSNKYGIAGSLVKFIDEKYGREVLIELIGFTTADQMLGYLKTTEKKLITTWKEDIRQHKSVNR